MVQEWTVHFLGTYQVLLHSCVTCHFCYWGTLGFSSTVSFVESSFMQSDYFLWFLELLRQK